MKIFRKRIICLNLGRTCYKLIKCSKVCKCYNGIQSSHNLWKKSLLNDGPNNWFRLQLSLIACHSHSKMPSVSTRRLTGSHIRADVYIMQKLSSDSKVTENYWRLLPETQLHFDGVHILRPSKSANTFIWQKSCPDKPLPYMHTWPRNCMPCSRCLFHPWNTSCCYGSLAVSLLATREWSFQGPSKVFYQVWEIYYLCFCKLVTNYGVFVYLN